MPQGIKRIKANETQHHVDFLITNFKYIFYFYDTDANFKLSTRLLTKSWNWYTFKLKIEKIKNKIKIDET